PSYGMATAPFGPGACASPRAQRHCGLVGPTGQAVLVSGCSDCTVVVGAAGRIVRLDRCDKVQVWLHSA
ncbi:C-CAP/cofactor C-like domain-containing protein, partial [Haematococcus lacustris]